MKTQKNKRKSELFSAKHKKELSSVKKRKFTGFTIVEFLVAIGIIVVLAGAIIVIINPGQRLAKARDNNRKADVQTTYGAIEQYVYQSGGTLPGSDGFCFDEKETGVLFDAYECEIYLTPAFLEKMPRDPACGEDEKTGYLLVKNETGTVGVKADCVEGEEEIIAGY